MTEAVIDNFLFKNTGEIAVVKRKSNMSDDNKISEMPDGSKLNLLLNWTTQMSHNFDVLASKLDNMTNAQLEMVERDHQLRTEREDEKHKRELRNGLAYRIFSESVVEMHKEAGSLATEDTYVKLADQAHKAAAVFMSMLD